MKTHVVWFCVAFAAMLLGGLTAKKEIQVVEKPVEVIRSKGVVAQTPVEVIEDAPKAADRPDAARTAALAEIPQNYVLAQLFFQSYSSAPAFEKNEVLKNLLNVKVTVAIGDNLKRFVSPSEVSETLEAALRQSGVRVSDTGKTLVFDFSGIEEGASATYACASTLSLLEDVNLLRPGGFRATVLPVWHLGRPGHAGQSRLGDEANFAAEQLAAAFANAYFSVNEK